MRPGNLALAALLGSSFFISEVIAAQPPPREPLRWWKGNLHTHSFWSDGDDFPESIADWYKTNGYHFLAVSDHNVMQVGTRWLTVTNQGREQAFEKYRTRFGDRWAEVRPSVPGFQVRLKPFEEFRRLFDERGRFLLIPSEEISAQHRVLPIHINATNLRMPLKPQGGTSVVDVMQRNIDLVLAQRRETGQPMFPHINHPNFGWAITAEDLIPLRGENFFEVHNGHPSVRNEGDAHHASVERMWDIILAFRLSRMNLGPLYGIGVDDSHHYHGFARTNSNPGRGWVMVRSRTLQTDALIAAMEAGDFYASSGVRLKDVRRRQRELSMEIEAEPGVTYTTHFIGTLRDFDPSSQSGPRPTNSIFAVTRRYSEDIGTVLGVAEGTRPSYAFQGDELYVRAKIVSSKRQMNSSLENDMESAWVQPLIPHLQSK